MSFLSFSLEKYKGRVIRQNSIILSVSCNLSKESSIDKILKRTNHELQAEHHAEKETKEKT